MNMTHATRIDGLLRTLPAAGVARDIALQLLTDLYATGEAMTALRTAAERARGVSGPLPEVLSAAAAADTADVDAPAERERRRAAFASPAFLELLPSWIKELRQIAVTHPGTGACTVASAMQLWLWTINHCEATSYGAIAAAELADAFGPLLAARCRILELTQATANPGAREFLADLCHVQAAHAAAAAGTACAELVFGYRRHLSWDAEGCSTCYGAEQLDELEGLMPGIASGARAYTDVIEADGAHAAKAGPCARFDGLDTFMRLRARLDGCLTGARRAKDRAAAMLPQVLSGTPAGLTL